MDWNLIEVLEIAVIIGLEVVTLCLDIRRDHHRKRQ